MIPNQLAEHAGQTVAGWPYLARVRIREGKMVEAVKLIRERQPVPAFASTGTSATVSGAPLDGIENPRTLAEGLALWKSLSSAGSHDRALSLAQGLVRENPSIPQLNYLVYQSCDRLGRIDETCAAWLRFDDAHYIGK
jgi:hypothetical protein